MSKSGSGTLIFCFTLTFCHILDDKRRAGGKITFSNHLLLIIEKRLISSFKGDDVNLSSEGAERWRRPAPRTELLKVLHSYLSRKLEKMPMSLIQGYAVSILMIRGP